MSGGLMRKVNGEAPVRRSDRAVVQRAKDVKDEVDLAAFMAAGAAALASQMMEDAVNLEDHRRLLAGGDPTKMALLAPFEAAALAKMQQIQRNLFNDWDL